MHKYVQMGLVFPIVTLFLLEHLLYFNGMQKNSIFTKRPILNAWEAFEYDSKYIEPCQPVP